MKERVKVLIKLWWAVPLAAFGLVIAAEVMMIYCQILVILGGEECECLPSGGMWVLYVLVGLWNAMFLADLWRSQPTLTPFQDFLREIPSGVKYAAGGLLLGKCLIFVGLTAYGFLEKIFSGNLALVLAVATAGVSAALILSLALFLAWLEC